MNKIKILKNLLESIKDNNTNYLNQYLNNFKIPDTIIITDNDLKIKIIPQLEYFNIKDENNKKIDNYMKFFKSNLKINLKNSKTENDPTFTDIEVPYTSNEGNGSISFSIYLDIIFNQRGDNIKFSLGLSKINDFINFLNNGLKNLTDYDHFVKYSFGNIENITDNIFKTRPTSKPTIFTAINNLETNEIKYKLVNDKFDISINNVDIIKQIIKSCSDIKNQFEKQLNNEIEFNISKL